MKKSLGFFFLFSFSIAALVFYFMQRTQGDNSDYKINASVLKMYDIRGTVDRDLFIEDAYYIGRGFATSLYRKYGSGDKRVIVGFDGRMSSRAMFDELKRGLIDAGVDVISIGLCTTPMTYYANIELDVDASIMITASHNPAEDNGFKMSMRGNEPFFDESIQTLGEIINRKDFHKFKEHGNFTEISIKDEYVKRIFRDLPSPKPLSIVWDCGNGVAGISLQEVIKRLPGTHVTLFCDVDGRFPNHQADPSVSANLIDLQKAVSEHHADLGVAFDGDADRMTVVDGSGRIIENDRLLVIFARDVLSRNPGASVIMDVKSSTLTMEEIRKAGGTPIMYKTGHSCIKNKMKEIEALVAGEVSGHFYWKEKFYGFDDGVYSALRLLDILSRTNDTMVQLNDSVPFGFTMEEVKVYLTSEQRDVIMGNLAKILKEENADVLDIDGLRVNRKQGWWLIRASQTSSAITIKCEGNTADGREKMVTEINTYLHKASNGEVELPRVLG